MNKNKIGHLLGISSLATVMISVVTFFVIRGPNADIPLAVKLFGTLSILGIVLAICSKLLTKRYSYLIIGILGNGLVLGYAVLLQFALGISESYNHFN